MMQHDANHRIADQQIQPGFGAVRGKTAEFLRPSASAA